MRIVRAMVWPVLFGGTLVVGFAFERWWPLAWVAALRLLRFGHDRRTEHAHHRDNEALVRSVRMYQQRGER